MQRTLCVGIGMDLALAAQPSSVVSVGTGSSEPAGASKRVSTQTFAVGVVVPPPELRSIVDKTAQFVSRNGPAFESRCVSCV